jgi:hypothetical protein
MNSKHIARIALTALMLTSAIACSKRVETGESIARPVAAGPEPECLARVKPKTEAEGRAKCPPGFVPSKPRNW